MLEMADLWLYDEQSLRAFCFANTIVVEHTSVSARAVLPEWKGQQQQQAEHQFSLSHNDTERISSPDTWICAKK